MDLTEHIGELAVGIRAELERVGAWSPDPPAEDVVLAGGAFGTGSVPFESWLQVVLVPRLLAVAAGEMEAPGSSDVGAHAVREWDGATDRDALIQLLVEVDDTVNAG
jgi:uncharacterized protein YqcC (DUF446 family)